MLQLHKHNKKQHCSSSPNMPYSTVCVGVANKNRQFDPKSLKKCCWCTIYVITIVLLYVKKHYICINIELNFDYSLKCTCQIGKMDSNGNFAILKLWKFLSLYI